MLQASVCLAVASVVEHADTDVCAQTSHDDETMLRMPLAQLHMRWPKDCAARFILVAQGRRSGSVDAVAADADADGRQNGGKVSRPLRDDADVRQHHQRTPVLLLGAHALMRVASD